MAIRDEIREQTQKTKEMTRKEKLGYFWMYYKVPFLATIIGIIVLISCIHSAMTHKDDALCAMLINADSSAMPTTTIDTWDKDLSSQLGIDTSKYQIYIDYSTSLSLYSNDQYALSNTEKFAAMCAANQIDDVICDDTMFEYYAQFQYYKDLSTVLTKDELAKYEGQIYYTDKSTFDNTDAENFDASEITDRKIDHHDPSTMKDPVAVGIYVTDSSKIKDSKCYDYLAAAKTQFQVQQSEAVLGISATTLHPEASITFLKYIMD